MKALYENIEIKKEGASFVGYNSIVPFFEFKWHYHPEYELTLITKGEGKRLVGDNYNSYTSGDLVLLGSGLPHTWTSEPKDSEDVSAVVIQFSYDFINSFLRYPEFKAISKLLADSSTGLHFKTVESENVIKEIKQLPEQSGSEKILLLLKILNQLSAIEAVPLASEFFNSPKGKENEARINKVCRHIHLHATENITLHEVAGLIHLSNSAFCKFFKRVTGKTFSDYVNDIRIGNACRLLTESDRNINDIAFACGYESLTYFNRMFLKKKNCTPGAFRKIHSSHKILT